MNKKTVPLGSLALLALASCASTPEVPGTDLASVTRRGAAPCTDADLTRRAASYLVDEASEGFRADLEAVIKSRGLAIVRMSCDRPLELLNGCEAPGEYSYVPLTPKARRLVMKDQADAQANLGFGMGQGLQAAFSAGRELTLDYRMAGAWRTTVPGVVRGQLDSPACKGATHLVTSVDTGAFTSWTSATARANANLNVAGQGGDASASTERSNLTTAGDAATCPAADAPSPPPGAPAPPGCSATVRVSLAPIVEGKTVAALGVKAQAKETECRKGWVLTNEEICVPREEAKVYLCEPDSFAECREMCLTPDDASYSRRSCGHLAALLMRHIIEAWEDTSAQDAKKQSRLNVLSEVAERNVFVKEAIDAFGPRLLQTCDEIANGNACALGALYRLVVLPQELEAAARLQDDPEATEADAERTMKEMTQALGRVFALVRRGCEDGEQFSCEVTQAILLENDDVWQPVVAAAGITNPQEASLALLHLSCDQGNARSCLELAEGSLTAGEAPDRDAIARFAERACTGGQFMGCLLNAFTRVGAGPLCNAMALAYQRSHEELAPAEDGLDVGSALQSVLCGGAPGTPPPIDYNAVSLEGVDQAFNGLRYGCDWGDAVSCDTSSWLYSQLVHTLIETRLDRCPDQEEDWDDHLDWDGCPDPDNDGDGILDGDDRCPDQAETVNGRADDDGCPEVALGEGSLDITEQIFFAPGKDAVLAESKPLLDDIGKLLVEHPGLNIEIGGHTDDKGNDKANKTLSQQRAERIRQELIARGVAASRLSAVGYGEERPRIPIGKKMTPRALKEARAANRRVEFKILNSNH